MPKAKKRGVLPIKKTKSKKRVETTLKKGKRKKGFNRYNEIQRILKGYSIESGIKFGKDSTRIASRLNKLTKGSPLKYVSQNIAELYREYFEKPLIVKEFPERFPYYLFLEKLLLPIFDDSVVSYTFDDKHQKFETSGNATEVGEYFKEETFRYCRTHYDSSPVAEFRIVDTDNKTFVVYALVPDTDGEKEPPKTEEKPPISDNNGKSGGVGTPEQQIALQTLKNENLKLEIEKLDKIMKLREMGYSKEEVNKMLGI